MRTVQLLALLTLLLPASAMAQVGKIAGRITDATSGDGLPGVSVVIDGTTQGSITDIDGYYNILNVRPGTYALRASFIGYSAQVIQGVNVDIDLTTEVNFALGEETVGLDEVVVIAEAPIIQQDISGAQRNIGAEEIQSGRFQNVTGVVGTTVGVNSISAYEDRPGIRGGAFDEALFIVDGVSQGDALTNRPYFKVNLDAVEEVKIQTGGFAAEYGNLQTGVVNVATKEGGDVYSGSINFSYSAPGIKHFGPMLYSHESPVTQPFVDPTMGAFTGYMMEQDGVTYKLDANGERIENPFFDAGWKGFYANAVNEGLAGPHFADLKDGAKDGQWTQTELEQSAQELYARYLWRHRSRDSIKKLQELGYDVSMDDAIHDYGTLPDYTAGFTLGGPIPLMNSVKFFVSYDRTQTEYNPRPVKRAYTDNSFRGRITTNLTSKTRLNLHGFYARQGGGDGGQGPGIDGFISSNPFNAMDAPNKLWYMHCAVPGQQTRQIYGGTLTHTATANTFFQLDFSHSRADYEMLQEHRNTAPEQGSPWGLTSLLEGLIGTEAQANQKAADGVFGWENWRDWAKIKIGDYYYDEAPWGYMPVQFRDESGIYRMSSCNIRFNETYSRQSRLWGSVTSQLNRFNQVKAGFEVERLNVFQMYNAIDPSVNGGDSTASSATPWMGAFYVQNKLEFRGLVANLGVRADWLRTAKFPRLIAGDPSDPEGGPYSDFLLGGRQDEFDAFPSKRRTHLVFSPRIGISHPITTVAKIFFNYGHAYQWPNALDMYRVERQRNQAFRVDGIGNPDLEPSRTIAYELGYEHNLFNRMNLRLTGYYRDVNNEYDTAEFYPISFGGENYATVTNQQFEDVRGFEALLELRRNTVPFISGWTSFDYRVETEGQFGYDRFYEDPTRQPRFVSSEVSDADVRPVIKANLDFHTPDVFGPGNESFSLLGGINVNLLYTWQRGRQMTWNPEELPLVENNVRWRPYTRWDMRFSKDLFRQGRFSSLFYIDVSNVFNKRNMTVQGVDGRISDWVWDDNEFFKNEFRAYMESLDLKVEKDGTTTGKYRPGDWKGDDIDLPGFYNFMFVEKRDIFFGVKLYF